MAEEHIICIGCPLGCRATLRIDRRGGILKMTGYRCKEGRKFILEEYRHPVRIFTGTVLTEKSSRTLLPVRTDQPIRKSKLREAAFALARMKVMPPVRMGQIILPNLLESGANVIATDDLLE